LWFGAIAYDTLYKGIKMKNVKTAVSALSQVSKSLANTEPVSNPYALNTEVINSIQTWSGLSKQASEAGDRLVDVLIANKVKPTQFVAFNESEDKQGISFRDNVFSHIVKGWGDKVAEKLVYADPKTLSVSEQAQQVVLRDFGRKAYNNLKAQLTRRLENADKKGKSAPASKAILAQRAVKQAIKYLEENKAGYAGMPEDIKALKGLVVLKVLK
jgi:hypothetical protein